jgi:preprotein translocase subunit SecE
MAETNEKKGISSWWSGIRSEFAKIVWADGDTIARQTTATCIASVVLALLIVFFDMIIQFGVDKLVGLGA